MRFREKLLILFVAIILSILGFVLISSSFVEIYTFAKEPGIERLEHSYSEEIGDKSLKILCLNFNGGSLCFLRMHGASK